MIFFRTSSWWLVPTLFVLVGFCLGFLVWDAAPFWLPAYQCFMTNAICCGILVVTIIFLIYLFPFRDQQHFLNGILLSMPFYGVGLSWFDIPLRDEHIPFPWGVILLVVSLLSTFVGATFWVAARLKSYPLLQVLLVPFVWVTGEVFRAEVFSLPYLSIPHGFMTMGLGIHVIGVLGVLLFSGFVMVTLVAHLQALVHPNFLRVIFVVLLWGCWGGLSSWPSVATPKGEKIQVRLVQSNLRTEDKWNPDYFDKNLQQFIDLSAKDQPSFLKVIIWPETAVTYLLDKDINLRKRIAKVIPVGGYLITGVPHVETDGQGAKVTRNRLIVLDDQGQLVDFYDKVHLLPFMEYTPFPFYHLGYDTSLDYRLGGGFKYIQLPNLLTFIPTICFDISFSHLFKNENKNAHFILNLSNDIFLGKRGSHLHFTHAMLGSVQAGIPLVRVSNGGLSGVVDPSGRVRSHLSFGVQGVCDFSL